MWALHKLKAGQDLQPYDSASSSQFTATEIEQFPVLSTRNFWCIQRHQATAHHYDLRMHLNGGLLSWAIPKGLLGMSKDAEPARLAIQTEIHPVRYAVHEVLWDVGQYFVDDIHTYDADSPESPWQDGADSQELGLFEERKLESAMKRIGDGDARSFHFFLRGGRKATFILVRTSDGGSRPKPNKPSWLVRLPKEVQGYPWDSEGEDGDGYGRSVKMVVEGGLRAS
ncbi:Multifunctional non-ous end joining protein LigD [Vanrija pseudolonga]|uniref:Multifunctional non-ous end joining protein LigD n=1 Tax=Vanrija pseudolonga TaxID=143232 RepID=A0AAF1BM11_9TREE|nr:Multifunctional non-ous end joining protein LigD [Vanrija pseudolonga]